MIDVNSGDEKLHINLDITFPKAPCMPLSLDIVDITGVHVVEIEGKLNKHRLDKFGNEIGIVEHIDEQGHAEVDPKEVMDDQFKESRKHMEMTMKVYDDTVKALEDKEGCKFSGFVFINKVPGNFHISGHHYPEAMHRVFMEGNQIDFTHKINHLSFGDLKDAEAVYH